MINLSSPLFLLCALLFAISSCNGHFDEEMKISSEPGNTVIPSHSESQDILVFMQDPLGRIFSSDNTDYNHKVAFTINCPKLEIFWSLHEDSPLGLYTFWVKNLQNCKNQNQSIQYILHVARGRKIIKTMSSTMQSGQTPLITYMHENVALPENTYRVYDVR